MKKIKLLRNVFIKDFSYFYHNVFRIGSVIEPKKLTGRTNDRTDDVINIYFIILYIIKN